MKNAISFFRNTWLLGGLLLPAFGPPAQAVPLGVWQQQPAGLVVQGRVLSSENQQPVGGVSVLLKGSRQGTATSADGGFQLSVPGPEAVLVLSNVGFVSQEITVGNRSRVDVTLQADTRSLDEVVVVGYGTQRKVNLTGSVDQVGSQVLQNRSLPNLSQGLQGVLPNLNIVPGDGKPIQSPAFNIRGTTSIGQGGNALVLIDNVEGDPARLNPSDIASITVLKDAASAAIYGARGAFGVVLITTKNPVRDKMSLTYSLNQSVKKPTAVPDFVSDGYTFARLFNEAWMAWNDYSQTPQNVNKTLRFSPAYLAEFGKRSKDPSLPRTEVGANGEYVYYENTDWYRWLYKPQTSSTDHNLAFSGSSGKADFYVTGRYYGQKGLFRFNSDDYSIVNLRAKGSIQVLPWLRVSNNADYSYWRYHNPLNVGEGGSIWRNISDEGHTNAPMFNPDGTLSYSAAYTVGDFWYGKNGIDMNRRVFRNTTGFAADFLKNVLRLKGDFTFQNTDNDEATLRVPVPYSRKPGVIEYVGLNTNDIENYHSLYRYMATNLYGEYEPKLGLAHYVKVLAGLNYEQTTFTGLRARRNGLIFADAKNLNLALGQAIETQGGYEQWAILGGFYRINYSYGDRYLLEFNGRYDGSSKFPANQRFAFFPSVSAGWRVSGEPFWKIPASFITDLKIRASYGSLGNGNIGSYAFQERFIISQMSRVLGGVRPQQTSQPAVLPDGLTWETATTRNVGFDLALLSNRLTLVADAYLRQTTNMFTVGPTLPATFGTDVPKGNYADLRTRGWEVVLGWQDNLNTGRKPLGYNLRLTLGDYTARITRYNNPSQRLNDYYVGQRLGEMWGYVTDGYFTSKEEIANSPRQVLIKASTSGQLLPGDIKFKDLNADGVINNGDNTAANPGDRRIIGNSLPRFTYSALMGADWHNFFFQAFLQGIGRQDWWPGGETMFWGQYNRPYNKIPSWHLNNMWSETNPNAYLPRLRGYVAQNGAGELNQVQTRYVQNIAYLRLRNIQLGYNLPSGLTRRLGMSAARVYVSGENLWAWSPLYKRSRDLDVESTRGSDLVLTSGTSGNGNNYPILKSYNVGISATF